MADEIKINLTVQELGNILNLVAAEARHWEKQVMKKGATGAMVRRAALHMDAANDLFEKLIEATDETP